MSSPDPLADRPHMAGTPETAGAVPGGPPPAEMARVVDALGKACPLPVIWLARAIDEVDVGHAVVVLADDPGAKVDIPVWCRMRRQDYLGVEDLDTGWRFTVRRSQ